MFNAIKKKVSKYTGLLIRIDDIAANMNWNYMDKCEKIFDDLKIKPLLGAVSYTHLTLPTSTTV